MATLSWSTPVQYIPMVGPVMAGHLEKLDIYTVGDLLTHKPHRYDDFSHIKKINEVRPGDVVTILADVKTTQNIYTRTRKQIQKALLTDETGSIEATWFNQPFLVKSLKGIKRIAAAGTAEQFGTRLQLVSPVIEIPKTPNLLHTGRLVPIYPETAGVSSKWLRTRINFLLQTSLISEYLPQKLVQKYDLLSLPVAVQKLHFPSETKTIVHALYRLAFDELLTRQLEAEMKRRQWNKQVSVVPFTWEPHHIKDFINNLPFSLTSDQVKVSGDILDDFKKGHPMNRLIQGDVGSGKTVVAALAIYIAKLNGARSLLMAPTEILAEQHFASLTKMLTPFNMSIGIQTGSIKTAGNSDLLIGTHALLEKNVTTQNTGLVIIDEQHRFGVRQRALLREKGKLPHVLTMTATPIPRTIALTLYGDLDLSVIRQMPVGRKQIKTWVVPPSKRQNAYEWIRKTINTIKRQQVFIVCPFIEPSETLASIKSAKNEYEKLKSVFPEFKLELLHGRMKAQEKNATLERFRHGEADILISTPVVEVGIDIPAATIMVIEGAERFGLAALHQLRGRVGRSDQQSYCLLFASSISQDLQRLKSLEKAASGAELAELDLQIRGPGQVFGIAQHGQDRLKIATYLDTALIEISRKEAQELLKSDPELAQQPLLKQRVLSGTIMNVVPD